MLVLIRPAGSVRRMAPGAVRGGIRMTFQGLPGPNSTLTLLDEGSYTLVGAVGFPILAAQLDAGVLEQVLATVLAAQAIEASPAELATRVVDAYRRAIEQHLGQTTAILGSDVDGRSVAEMMEAENGTSR